jgi:lysyl-tRNA synthetase class I
MGALIIGFLLFIRFKDLPEPKPISPFRHLDERKASIYENLRDLQFEYRLNKLSDEDYQASKLGLQKELAKVLEETDRIKAQIGQQPGQPVKVAAAPVPQKPACAKCGATFEKSPKFCPDCGAAQ